MNKACNAFKENRSAEKKGQGLARLTHDKKHFEKNHGPQTRLKNGGRAQKH